ncbi:MAG: hypothetical protein ACOC7U_07190 [Spirochaetota bacterium]
MQVQKKPEPLGREEPGPAPPEGITKSEKIKPPQQTGYSTVQKGDTLSQISLEYTRRLENIHT